MRETVLCSGIDTQSMHGLGVLVGCWWREVENAMDFWSCPSKNGVAPFATVLAVALVVSVPIGVVVVFSRRVRWLGPLGATFVGHGCKKKGVFFKRFLRLG